MLVKILQANLNRCRAAHDVLEATARRGRIDIVVASEPNHSRLNATWYVDQQEGDVAVQVRGDPGARVTAAGSPGRGITWVRVDGWAIVGCYASPNKSDVEFNSWLDILRDCLRTLGSRIIVGGDFNAKSPH